MNRQQKYGVCRLCERETYLTFHHLIPRKLHKRRRFVKTYTKEQLNEGVMLCPRCHKGLHKLHSESELGNQLNTLESLLADPAVSKHVAWVAKQRG